MRWPGEDAKLHAEVVWRLAGGGAMDQRIVSADSNVLKNSDGGVPGGSIAAVVDGAAVEAKCGDRLVLIVTLVSGSSDFLEIGVRLDIP